MRSADHWNSCNKFHFSNAQSLQSIPFQQCAVFAINSIPAMCSLRNQLHFSNPQPAIYNTCRVFHFSNPQSSQWISFQQSAVFAESSISAIHSTHREKTNTTSVIGNLQYKFYFLFKCFCNFAKLPIQFEFSYLKYSFLVYMDFATEWSKQCSHYKAIFSLYTYFTWPRSWSWKMVRQLELELLLLYFELLLSFRSLV